MLTFFLLNLLGSSREKSNIQHCKLLEPLPLRLWSVVSDNGRIPCHLRLERPLLNLSNCICGSYFREVRINCLKYGVLLVRLKKISACSV